MELVQLSKVAGQDKVLAHTNWSAMFDVAVVIPTKEIDAMLVDHVARINQLYPGIEVIVVADVLGTEAIEAKVIEADSPVLGLKRNLGVKHTDKTYIAFIDSDAYPDEGWLETAIEQLEKNKSIGIVGGPNLPHPDETREQRLGALACDSSLVVGPNTFWKRRSATRFVSELPSSNMVFRRQDYLDIGGMSGQVMTGEDIVFYVHMAGLGKKILFHQNVRVFHFNRGLKPFLRQRYVWGKGVFSVLRIVFPAYLMSLMPFFFVSALLLLGLVGLFWTPALAFFAAILGLYTAAALFESIRIGKSDWLYLFPFIAGANISSGLGAINGALFGDSAKSYGLYTRT